MHRELFFINLSLNLRPAFVRLCKFAAELS
jgi:hypothetical protein